jgi:hypothetical protein
VRAAGAAVLVVVEVEGKRDGRSAAVSSFVATRRTETDKTSKTIADNNNNDVNGVEAVWRPGRRAVNE